MHGYHCSFVAFLDKAVETVSSNFDFFNWFTVNILTLPTRTVQCLCQADALTMTFFSLCFVVYFMKLSADCGFYVMLCPIILRHVTLCYFQKQHLTALSLL